MTVDLDAVAENWRMLARRAPGAACAAVVKADAYGLGAAPVARALHRAGCRVFFVACPAEGAALRRALDDMPHAAPRRAATGGGAEILVLDGRLDGEAARYDRHRLTPVLGTPEAVALWARHGRDRGGRRAALMLDTGMSRLGLGPAEAEALAADPGRLAGIELAWTMSHLACADTPQHPLNGRQKAAFDALRARLPAAPASLANSAGIHLGPDFHYDLVRPGAALYGLAAVTGRSNPMRRAVRLQARILQVRRVDRETPVGYGAERLAAAGATLATVAMGYADGLPRALGNRGSGRVGGKPAPFAGRVSMDLATLDVTGIAPDLVRPGGAVDLIDDDHDADALAAEAGTIGYEILARMGGRVRRRYRGGQDAADG